MAYLINYWKFNEIRKYNHKPSNVSQHPSKNLLKMHNFHTEDNSWTTSQYKLEKVSHNRPLAQWHHFTTTTWILQGFAFLCKLGLLLFNPRWDYQILIWKEKRNGSGRSSKMTPSWKWSVTLAKLGFLVTQLKLSPIGRGLEKSTFIIKLIKDLPI